MENRKLLWISSSKKDLGEFPITVKDKVLFALSIAQGGGKHADTKPLKGYSGASVLEIVQKGKNATFRAVYTVAFKEAIFVLHCFQKKSKQGIKTPKQEMDLIDKRLMQAKAIYAELFKGKMK